MKAYVYCPRCSAIHGCVEILNGKQNVKICFNCRFKKILPCEVDEPQNEVKQLCIIDLAFIDKN